ncbi:MAG: type II CRISPR-associated endonuclease Cas1 [Flavobacteriaceae bacterium CG_4_8_14_3_um_filter_34_10]|nr:MAG: type II CRISPR-associated endonuclease Cas1 [Flavobacteriaceae bacterium CG18_big_fil_WC_8_21_14_2_50_34_36]PIV49802.1 MAG: type II CRISPR-associated endonuclease Cas1 [Flavobacteriaceae bacterium CG02_land_8_20_14_3_00_34_13]PIX08875.1 MAG: type II CRISPR-associated endonuclease Cas1 [Flavobacteriaceae bacterium CG_4_8_14_3_um_filter_34_10]
MLKKTLFFGNKASIHTKLEQLQIKTEQRETTVPIEDIGFLVIEHPEIFISIPTLSKLVENNVAVVFCNQKHMPSSMLLNLDGHHLQQEQFKNQINATVPLKKQLWQQTIKTKISNQCQLLEREKKPFEVMHFHESKVLSGDTENREGAAAAHYWKHLFDFPFKRERFGAYPNLFLNYGYIILRAAMARALSGSGLLCTLGIHHHNKYNAFCLADDMMEPYRPLVDAKVLEIIKEFETQELTIEIKTALLGVLTQTVYFEDMKSPLMVALSRTASSLQQCYAGTNKKINYPKLWI